MNQALVIDPSSNHIVPINELKALRCFDDLKKVIDSVNVGVENLNTSLMENLHESFTKFTESLGISYDEKHWLPWDPLTTETEYAVRPIDIRKGGWGR